MREEDRSYIESYLAKVIGICINLSYARDRLGNVTFKNKEGLNNNINRLITQTASQLETSEEEIRGYLIETYKKKGEEPEYRVETQGFISVLEGMQPKDYEKRKESNIEELIK